MLDGAPFGLEKIWEYEPGGHHPVHLGDQLGPEGRYRVIHKLGSGGFGNVWMSRDLSSDQAAYVAVKILMADYSNDECQELRVWKLKGLGVEESLWGRHICLPLETFRIEGPNGSHRCFVYPVLGPRVAQSPEDGAGAKRRLILQTTQAMAALHERGICHGDLTPSNVLLRVSGLNGLTEESVLQALGEPRRTLVTTYNGEPHLLPSAPKYLVYPVNFNKHGSQFITNEACVIDFGESFKTTHPPDELGTPMSYYSPELILDKAAGTASDLWALGCTLFEIRTGRKLLETIDDEEDDYLFAMTLLLGILPEPWWTNWEARKDCFQDEADAEGNVVKLHEMENNNNISESALLAGTVIIVPQHGYYSSVACGSPSIIVGDRRGDGTSEGTVNMGLGMLVARLTRRIHLCKSEQTGNPSSTTTTLILADYYTPFHTWTQYT